MKNIDVIKMIDQEFEEFEQDRNRSRNLKALLNFKSSELMYNEKSIIMAEPKFKKKYNTSVYVKNTNKNQLF